MKKQKRSTLKNKATKIASEIVRSRGYCEWCGARNVRFEAAHIISRTYSKTRCDLNNMLCLCSACHRKGHQFPTLFTELVIKIIGQEKLDELHAEAQRTDYKVDYGAIIADLKDKYEF